MPQITFPLLPTGSGDVTVDSAEIATYGPVGGMTLVHMKDGTMYRSPAPHELFDQAMATGGVVASLGKPT